MSEVDRLSNSGLYPALPIADKQRGKDESPGKPPPDPRANKADPPAATKPDPDSPRPPKSIIDEYA
ncbi:MAG TPA: hypothetical protein VNR70_00740 [Steroidobacteraceae bacterium]|jgi:hypothetical protein|nr:hypothetical protein [Steroidobacteraceae bacterium]